MPAIRLHGKGLKEKSNKMFPIFSAPVRKAGLLAKQVNIDIVIYCFKEFLGALFTNTTCIAGLGKEKPTLLLNLLYKFQFSYPEPEARPNT